jgi:hypothetical protein
VRSTLAEKIVEIRGIVVEVVVFHVLFFGRSDKILSV